MPVKLFGVRLPEVSKSQLIQNISSVKKNTKQTVYFLYSEFVLRANRNPYYKQVLNNSEFSAIDGRGLLWAQMKIQNRGILVRFYEKKCLDLPWLPRLLIFIMFFIGECVTSTLSGFYNLVLNKNFSEKVENELVLGRDFVYNLFEIAEKKKWKTLIVGGNPENNDIIRSKILEKHPKINLDLISRNSDSRLMRDQFSTSFEKEVRRDGVVLNSQNLFEAFPDLKEAKDYIKKNKFDMILVCLGGRSGKQEFFIDNLKNDPAVKFTVATGVGAALDHLGAGASQEKPPVWMTEAGLEWVFRFIKQPYRRLRILDSIFTLWWWTTLEQFSLNLGYRKTIVNLIFREIEKKEGYEYLLVRRLNLLPGDVAWSFVQGGVEKGEVLELAGLRETKEEVGLNNWDFKVLRQSYFVNHEDYAVSFLRFLALGAKYKGSENYLNVMEYYGTKEPLANWENKEARWFEEASVSKYLSLEKHIIWEKAIAGE